MAQSRALWIAGAAAALGGIGAFAWWKSKAAAAAANGTTVAPACANWVTSVSDAATAIAVAISDGSGPTPWVNGGFWYQQINGVWWRFEMTNQSGGKDVYTSYCG